MSGGAGGGRPFFRLGGAARRALQVRREQDADGDGGQGGADQRGNGDGAKIVRQRPRSGLHGRGIIAHHHPPDGGRQIVLDAPADRMGQCAGRGADPRGQAAEQHRAAIVQDVDGVHRRIEPGFARHQLGQGGLRRQGDAEAGGELGGGGDAFRRDAESRLDGAPMRILQGDVGEIRAERDAGRGDHREQCDKAQGGSDHLCNPAKRLHSVRAGR
ncbi:MAG: hypothetical protein B7Y95_19900 [Rhizobiales bacterium 32-66-11]|nr:MAG: hypothetical protein B7Y95_19900 [Rhizobiales bacterium 32-66-11]